MPASDASDQSACFNWLFFRQKLTSFSHAVTFRLSRQCRLYSRSTSFPPSVERCKLY